MKTSHTYKGPCPECGQGTIEPTRFQNYKTTIRGYPFTVPEAWIGVCDTCGVRTFNAQETVLVQRELEFSPPRISYY